MLDPKIKQLEEMIVQQNKVILTLQNKIELLEDKVVRLAICKISNGNYPYYDFLLSYHITPEQQFQIKRLFMVLSEKRSGNTLPVSFKSSESYSTDFLYEDSTITYNDVKNSILTILLNTDDDLPLSLITAMRDQGMQTELCDYLISLAKNET
ncbi:hypothetical protein MH117_01560 [Paenibacillus sp. ACRRX]|uniref:hypothetical protein n=1 Tax=Paenibacillus sp. UMB4589-SE434 TaxID=3046314 RepID=UPI00254E9C00|nr:hypothetical protein [Paenibacillus sp. UMB4589-SE434]MCG7406087.1 hypothetical protein [Paenibacillus sp. ACRRX]MDK8182541.1 hypothetical protein [Paenibacillus sp. UMB4589-SE434]